MGRKTFVVLLLAVIIGSAFAQELPRLINYQGKLTNPDGVAVDAPVDITFRIYDVETGGTALWTEAHTGASRITVTNGLFDVQLGGITDLDLPFDDEYWIELQVGTEVLTPREKLATVPYAFRAIYADTAFIIGSGAVQTDATIDGDGTDADPLGVVWGSVTQHTDVTNAGSGAIITTGERALLHASGSDNQDLFNRVSDGTNTYTVATETDILTFAATGGADVAVNPTTGVVTIDASSAGDEWGSQVVESDATLTGEGVTGNLLGIAADGVNDTHIDWGLGANEVGAGDVPYDNTTSGLTASDVQAALDEIAGGGSAITHSLQDAYDDGSDITVATGVPVSITSTGATHALTAVSGSGRAINASNNSTTNPAVYATNAGTGPAIYSSGHLRMSGASGVKIYSTADLNIQLDEGGSGSTTNTLYIRDDAFASVFTVDENGDVAAAGNITATNNLLGADLSLGGTLLSSTAATSGAGLVGYSNTASGLVATDVQDAIDELDAAIAASGDDWGSDVVNSDATLTGNGTAGSPLGVVWGSVTQHTDVTNAGSGAIITAAERALLHAEGTDLQTVSGSGTSAFTLSDGGGTITLAGTGGATVTRSGNTLTIDAAGAGDDWGSDVVNSDATLTGNGTSGSPLGVVWGSVTQHTDVTNAGSGAIITAAERALLHASGSDNQNLFNRVSDGTNTYTVATETDILTFAASGGADVDVNPTTGVVTIDASSAGDDWGSQVASTTARLSGDGTAGDPLDIAQQGATSGQVLKWNGTSWAPDSDNNTTYSAGNGISLSATTFSVAGGSGLLQEASGLRLQYINAGSSNQGALWYNGLGRVAGNLYGGTIDPISSNRLNYDGYFYATRLYSGGNQVLTGNQTITLDGDVTGSGATSIATTIADNAVTSAKILNGTIVNADISASAAIDWSKLANGTANRILMTNGSGGITVVPAPTTDYYLKWNGTAYIWAAASTDLANHIAGNGLSGANYDGSGDVTWTVDAGDGINVDASGVSVDAADGTIDVSADGIKVGLGAAQSTSTSYQLHRNY